MINYCKMSLDKSIKLFKLGKLYCQNVVLVLIFPNSKANKLVQNIETFPYLLFVLPFFQDTLDN